MVRLTSLTPEVAGLINDLNRAVHINATGLSRKEQEIAALVVAVYNGCVH
jgi:alkylhydroperoxidase family enzyme